MGNLTATLALCSHQAPPQDELAIMAPGPLVAGLMKDIDLSVAWHNWDPP